jgi:predicted ArsR family transcriptional regulator
MPGDESARRARFHYGGLERVIHEKARLGILTALVTEPDGVAFSDLKLLCDLTDGNLSRHLSTLVEADLVAAEREEEGGRPQSVYRLTREGRARFLGYLEELQRVVADAAPARAPRRQRRGSPRPGQAGA